jgi:glycerol-3-phosphate dehydrogenase (NAD(P)+)
LLEIDMPITQTVVDLLDNRLTMAQAAAQLLARPLKEE